VARATCRTGCASPRRDIIDCHRWQADAPEIPIASDLFDVLPEPGADPELQLLKREHAAHFKAAFAEAVARSTRRIGWCSSRTWSRS